MDPPTTSSTLEHHAYRQSSSISSPQHQGRRLSGKSAHSIPATSPVLSPNNPHDEYNVPNNHPQQTNQQYQQHLQYSQNPQHSQYTQHMQCQQQHSAKYPSYYNKSSITNRNTSSDYRTMRNYRNFRNSRNAAKIIKGEIHNVLTVMRSDPRYSSEWGSDGNTANAGYESYDSGVEGRESGSFSSHPILQGLRDLHDVLSSMEVNLMNHLSYSNQSSNGRLSSLSGGLHGLNAVTFVAPFAAAVCSREVDARTTAAAIGALHKFILYGFIGGHGSLDQNGNYGLMDGAFPLDTLDFSDGALAEDVAVGDAGDEVVRESITLVAQCIRNCALEESFQNRPSRGTQSSSLTPKSAFSFWGGSGEKGAPRADQTQSKEKSSNASKKIEQLPSFLVEPFNTSSYPFYSHQDDDDINDVILKLLSLSVQVLRCPAGRIYLSPTDIVGIFDVCLHVAMMARGSRTGRADGSKKRDSSAGTNVNQRSNRHRKNRYGSNRSLLRSAAADALGHCVIVVFGMRGRQSRSMTARGRRNVIENIDAGTNNNQGMSGMDATADISASSDSDDDWGERDPAEDISCSDGLLVGNSPHLKPNTTCASSSVHISDTSTKANEETSNKNGIIKSDQHGSNEQAATKESNESVSGKEEQTSQKKPVKEGKESTERKNEEPALVPIMHRLATLADPLLHQNDSDDNYDNCILSLTLINIALETTSDDGFDVSKGSSSSNNNSGGFDALATQYPRLLAILQNDLCRNLLRLSTSQDLTILGLTLRVIFNLFNGIKDHLKVQLEVFLTSVHLRILSSSLSVVKSNNHGRSSSPGKGHGELVKGQDGKGNNGKKLIWSSTPERRELALESLLEFCREPMLMMDLYLNYDCDIQCTNLFETICVTLARVACPDDEYGDVNSVADGGNDGAKTKDGIEYEDDGDEWQPPQQARLNILNRLALEGILAVIDSIARRCRLSATSTSSATTGHHYLSSETLMHPMHSEGVFSPSPPDSGNWDLLGNTLCIENGDGNGSAGAVPMHESMEYDFCSVSTTSDASKSAAMHSSQSQSANQAMYTTPAKRPTFSNLRLDSEISEDDKDYISQTPQHALTPHPSHLHSLYLRERKLRKRRLAKAASSFNDLPKEKEWMLELQHLHVIPTPPTPSSVAHFLFNTPKLDMEKVGLYLSKGPKEKYPFHAEVLKEFTNLFEFEDGDGSSLSFSGALRLFLSTFRLPGEAQCIDRLMEAFASRLFEVQQKKICGSKNILSEVENSMLEPPRSHSNENSNGSNTSSGSKFAGRSVSMDPPTEEPDETNEDFIFPFQSSDAVFILSFSTIMLNTDLHNPNMKDEKRMTLEQFLRNNRGINDGQDLPVEFLTQLYFDIKNDEIQLHKSFLDSYDTAEGGNQFDGIFNKASDVSTPFTPFYTHSANATFLPSQSLVTATIHERDMFLSISQPTIQSISAVFVRTWNDLLVLKSLSGLENSARICVYFGLIGEFNEILKELLSFGLDYVSSVVGLIYEVKFEEEDWELDGVGGASRVGSGDGVAASVGEAFVAEIPAKAKDLESELEEELISHDYPPIPKSFLSKLHQDTKTSASHITSGNSADVTNVISADITGSAAHRGILSLETALTLCRNHLSLIQDSWPLLLEVVLALRDVNALPPRLSDLDDFADSQGNPLPMSKFGTDCEERVNEYRDSLRPEEKKSSGSGFWKSVLGLGGGDSSSPRSLRSSRRDRGKKVDKAAPGAVAEGAGSSQKVDPLSETLQQVAKSAQLDQIIMKTSNTTAKRIAHAMLETMFPSSDVKVDEQFTSDSLFEHNAVFVLELAARLLISNRVHAAEIFPIFLTKFEVLLSPSKEGKSTPAQLSLLGLQFPYLLERIIVTIFRSCIHLYDIPEIRTQLLKLLHLISQLPISYSRTISDRLGCGAAIILRGCFFLFDSADEWTTMKSLLDLAAQDSSGRRFVFDGIASVIDYALFTSMDGEGHIKVEMNSEVPLSLVGAEAMAELLLKFLEGTYEGDMSFLVDSMSYVQKLYSFLQDPVHNPSAVTESNPKIESIEERGVDWEKIVTTMYNDVCLSNDSAASKQGFESLLGVLLSTTVESIPESKWFTLLDMVISNPPPISSQSSRIDSLSLIGRLFLTLMPALSNNKKNWMVLEESTLAVAQMVNENLRAGRATPLFETTVHTVTNISNVMSMSGFNEGMGVNFCGWVGETLLYELEKVGACGGVMSMMAAAHASHK